LTRFRPARARGAGGEGNFLEIFISRRKIGVFYCSFKIPKT